MLLITILLVFPLFTVDAVPTCDLKAIFRTPPKRNHDDLEILERSSFDAEPANVPNPTTEIQDCPKSYANAQILLRFGGEEDKSPVVCACGPNCQCSKCRADDNNSPIVTSISNHSPHFTAIPNQLPHLTPISTHLPHFIPIPNHLTSPFYQPFPVPQSYNKDVNEPHNHLPPFYNPYFPYPHFSMPPPAYNPFYNPLYHSLLPQMPPPKSVENKKDEPIRMCLMEKTIKRQPLEPSIVNNRPQILKPISISGQIEGVQNEKAAGQMTGEIDRAHNKSEEDEDYEDDNENNNNKPKPEDVEKELVEKIKEDIKKIKEETEKIERKDNETKTETIKGDVNKGTVKDEEEKGEELQEVMNEEEKVKAKEPEKEADVKITKIEQPPPEPKSQPKDKQPQSISTLLQKAIVPLIVCSKCNPTPKQKLLLTYPITTPTNQEKPIIRAGGCTCSLNPPQHSTILDLLVPRIVDELLSRKLLVLKAAQSQPFISTPKTTPVKYEVSGYKMSSGSGYFSDPFRTVVYKRPTLYSVYGGQGEYPSQPVKSIPSDKHSEGCKCVSCAKYEKELNEYN